MDFHSFRTQNKLFIYFSKKVTLYLNIAGKKSKSCNAEGNRNQKTTTNTKHPNNIFILNTSSTETAGFRSMGLRPGCGIPNVSGAVYLVWEYLDFDYRIISVYI